MTTSFDFYADDVLILFLLQLSSQTFFFCPCIKVTNMNEFIFALHLKCRRIKMRFWNVNLHSSQYANNVVSQLFEVFEHKVYVCHHFFLNPKQASPNTLAFQFICTMFRFSIVCADLYFDVQCRRPQAVKYFGESLDYLFPMITVALHLHSSLSEICNTTFFFFKRRENQRTYHRVVTWVILICKFLKYNSY